MRRSLTEAFPILIIIVLVNIVLFIFESQENVEISILMSCVFGEFPFSRLTVYVSRNLRKVKSSFAMIINPHIL